MQHTWAPLTCLRDPIALAVRSSLGGTCGPTTVATSASERRARRLPVVGRIGFKLKVLAGPGPGRRTRRPSRGPTSTLGSCSRFRLAPELLVAVLRSTGCPPSGPALPSSLPVQHRSMRDGMRRRRRKGTWSACPLPALRATAIRKMLPQSVLLRWSRGKNDNLKGDPPATGQGAWRFRCRIPELAPSNLKAPWPSRLWPCRWQRPALRQRSATGTSWHTVAVTARGHCAASETVAGAWASQSTPISEIGVASRALTLCYEPIKCPLSNLNKPGALAEVPAVCSLGTTLLVVSCNLVHNQLSHRLVYSVQGKENWSSFSVSLY